MSEITASRRQRKKRNRIPQKVPNVPAKRQSSRSIRRSTWTSFGELAELVNEHGFTDFEFENENIRVRLSKAVAQPLNPQYQPRRLLRPERCSPLPPQPKPNRQHLSEEELYKITSPIVGTFYRSSGPDKEPYVKEGSKVTPETSVVCIVEAMKLMNEIQAEAAGEIVKVYVENGQPVEYGQPLFGIRK